MESESPIVIVIPLFLIVAPASKQCNYKQVIKAPLHQLQLNSIIEEDDINHLCRTKCLPVGSLITFYLNNLNPCQEQILMKEVSVLLMKLNRY